MLVSEILTRVKRTFGDESGVQVQDDDILRWINDGQRQFVLENDGLLETTATAASVTGQMEYAIPTDLLLLKGISYKGPGYASYVRLKGYSKNEFDDYIDGWDGNTTIGGTPSCYMIFAGKINLFPVPSASLPTAIKIYYNRKPTDVVVNTDTPEIPVLYHETLVKYCLAMAYELDEDLEAVSAKGNQIDADLKLLRGRDDWRDQATYPVITVLPEDAW